MKIRRHYNRNLKKVLQIVIGQSEAYYYIEEDKLLWIRKGPWGIFLCDWLIKLAIKNRLKCMK